MENSNIKFPEFENYQIFEGKMKIEKPEGKMTQAFKYVGNGLENIASFFGNKYQEYDIGSKIKNGGAATLKGLSIAGNYLYDLSKPAINYASDKAKEGVGYFYGKKNENNQNKENIILCRMNNDNEEEREDDEYQDNGLTLKMSSYNPIRSENCSNNNLDYPTLNKINIVNNEEKKKIIESEEKITENNENKEGNNINEINEINKIKSDENIENKKEENNKIKKEENNNSAVPIENIICIERDEDNK